MDVDAVESRVGREHGQTMAEYAVILGVITPAIVVAFALLSDAAAKAITKVVDIIGAAL